MGRFGSDHAQHLRAGITRACFYEPLVNRTYADMASHYGTAVIPARPYKPRDKAKVEVGVQVVQRWILARLRNRRFFSLAELNQAIRELVIQLNDRPMRGWGAPISGAGGTDEARALSGPSRGLKLDRVMGEQNRNIHRRDVESGGAPALETHSATRAYPLDSCGAH
jgi:hypothetical protein